MINKYPAWKNILVLAVFVLSLLYALPNLFSSDFAVQISKLGPTNISIKDSKLIKYYLNKANIDYQNIKNINNNVLIILKNSQEQLNTQALLKDKLGRKFSIALNLVPSIPDWLQFFGAKPMFLGLDLRGGVHFLLEVDMDTVVKNAYKNQTAEIRSEFRKKRLYRKIHNKGDYIEVIFKDNASKSTAITMLENDFSDFIIEQENDLLVTLKFKEQILKEYKKHALKQNITTLRNRVNELGVSEPIIQQQGSDRIVVQLPGVQDTSRAKEILGAVATLEFHMVDEKNDAETAINSGRIPIESQVYRFRDGRPLLLKKQLIITGESINNATSGFSQENNSPMVSLSLDGKGGKAMLKTTKKYVGHRMAVVFIENKIETIYRNGKLTKKRHKTKDIINAAVINGIFSNRFQITGLDSPKEARDLALLLRAGSLSAPIEIIEERTVGPSLGKDNIEKGFISVITGFILVLIFMLLRYKVFGIVANIALTLNLLMIITVLSLLQATLTLPGIAGIVLTVGMAVDANVLIFERIREELKNNINTQKAINSGYEKALSTITDANITTLIAAVVLFSFGTGPIKGFAITLSIGIVTSMFCAIIVSRAIINKIYGSKPNKILRI